MRSRSWEMTVSRASESSTWPRTISTSSSVGLLGVLTGVPVAVIHHRHQGFEDAKAVAVGALIGPVIPAPNAGDGDARALGFIHALVGSGQQGVGRARVLGERRHADGELHGEMDALRRDQGRDGGQIGNAL